MKVGDLVKIDPIFTDDQWVDIVFLILEIKSNSATVFAKNEEFQIEINKLEIFSKC